MRVIVINPWDQTVTETEHNGDFRDYYRLMSGPTLEELPDADVSFFDIVPVGDPAGHIMAIDDEGMFAEPQAHFALGFQQSTFAGRAVIARSEGGEDEVGATISVADVLASIRWIAVGTEISVPLPVVESFDSFDAMLERINERNKDAQPLIVSRK